MTSLQLCIFMKNSNFDGEMVVVRNDVVNTSSAHLFLLLFLWAYSSQSNKCRRWRDINFFSINNTRYWWSKITSIVFGTRFGYTYLFHSNLSVCMCPICANKSSLYKRPHFPDHYIEQLNNNMFIIRTIGITAIAASVGTIMVAFFYIPLIIMKITEINERVISLLRRKVFTVLSTHSGESLVTAPKVIK